jgi:transcriptional regulator with XRE-family HTH domain
MAEKGHWRDKANRPANQEVIQNAEAVARTISHNVVSALDGIDVRNLAEQSGVSTGIIRDLKFGRNTERVGIADLEMIRQALGKDPKEFYGDV